jgi:hypothetical protein
MEISWKDFLDRSEKLYGKEQEKHQYKCPCCGRVQSILTLREQKKAGVPSKRYGPITTENAAYFFSECLSPNCNWVAYGLFNSGILIIEDSSKPHNEATKENCGYTFPLAHDEEMCKAAGTKPEPPIINVEEKSVP